MDNIIHIAADRLGPNGELYQCCNGEPLALLPVEYTLDDRVEEARSPVFCRACVAVARLVGVKSRR